MYSMKINPSLLMFLLIPFQSIQAQSNAPDYLKDVPIPVIEVENTGPQNKSTCLKLAGKWIDQNGTKGCLINQKKEGKWESSLEKEVNAVKFREDASVFFKDNALTGKFERYINGVLIESGTYDKNQKVGKWEGWYLGGQKRSEYYYENHQQNGTFSLWNADCLISQKGGYYQDSLHGPYTAWNESGHKSEEGFYDLGIKKGHWKEYHLESGVLIAEGNMENGMKEGKWKHYFFNGAPWRDVDYQKGILQSEESEKCRSMKGEWQLDHKKRTEFCIQAGKKIYIEKTYDENAKIASIIEYDNGKKNGISTIFHPNGKILSKGLYQEDIPEGLHEFKDENGQLISSSLINQGSGYWKEFYANGKLKMEGLFFQKARVKLWKFYYPSGKLDEEVPFDDYGVMNGLSKSYFENGLVSSQGNYTDNRRDGIWKYYYMNGQTYVEALFRQGSRDGIWNEWNWKGVPKYYGKYKDNTENDLWQFFHPNGKIKEKGRYSEYGSKQGIWELFWASGIKWKEVSYINGKPMDADEYQNICGNEYYGEWSEDLEQRIVGCKVCRNSDQEGRVMVSMGVWQWWHPNGILEKKGTLIENKKNQLWEYFDDSGNLRSKGEYIDDQKNGKWLAYYDNGQLNYEGEFKLGQESGEWKIFHDNGNIASVGNYEQEKRIGVWKWYHLNGQLSQIGSYDQGHRTGLWFSYDDQGKIIEQAQYEKGKKFGVWRWWKEDGKGWKAMFYGNDEKLKIELPMPKALSADEIEAAKNQVNPKLDEVIAQKSDEIMKQLTVTPIKVNEPKPAEQVPAEQKPMEEKAVEPAPIEQKPTEQKPKNKKKKPGIKALKTPQTKD